jgi:hypothetical protein
MIAKAKSTAGITIACQSGSVLHCDSTKQYETPLNVSQHPLFLTHFRVAHELIILQIIIVSGLSIDLMVGIIEQNKKRIGLQVYLL